MKFLNLLIIGHLMLLLTACGSSPSPVLPPLELTPLKNEIRVSHDWTRHLDQGASFAYLKLTPVVTDDKLYSIDHTGYLQLIDLETGKKLWDKNLNTAVSTALSLQQNQLFVGTSQGEVIALSADKGEILWRQTLSSEVLAPARAENGVVVVRTVDGKLYGLNAIDGSRRWTYSREVPLLTLRGNSTPVISNNIVLMGSDNGKLTALTLEQGTMLWEATIAVPQGRTELERIIDIDAELVVVKDVVYVISYQGRVAAVQINSGRIHWAREMSSYSGFQVDPYRVYLTDAEGYIWALNRFNGATIWRQDKLLRRSLTRPVLQEGYLVVADFKGYLHWLSREDGHFVARRRVNEEHYLFTTPDPEEELLFDRAENVLATPIVAGKTVYALDRMGTLSAFSLQQ
ncbi:MAG: outer membrane protein assembly factor BamB [Thioalkalispiraceae bacterium]|jgi:outer membrane protein assembly factor BamB